MNKYKDPVLTTVHTPGVSPSASGDMGSGEVVEITNENILEVYETQKSNSNGYVYRVLYVFVDVPVYFTVSVHIPENGNQDEVSFFKDYALDKNCLKGIKGIPYVRSGTVGTGSFYCCGYCYGRVQIDMEDKSEEQSMLIYFLGIDLKPILGKTYHTLIDRDEFLYGRTSFQIRTLAADMEKVIESM